MSESLATTDNLPAQQQQPNDNNNELSPPELHAIAQSTLTPVEYTLWCKLHNAVETRGQSCLSALVRQAGFSDYSNAKAVEIVNSVFGKMERIGITRARSFDVLCGFTSETVKLNLTALMASADEKIQCKATDIASKVMGLQKTGNQSVTVNNTIGIQVTTRAIALTDESESD